MNDVLQVPMSKELREKATLAALAQGYSSLQEQVRVLLRQSADGKLNTAFVPTVNLSVKAIKRYKKILDDYKEKKNITSFDSVDDFIKYTDSLR